jgi:hypothetical protein
LQKLAFAFRTSINETTCDTPAYLNLGRDPRTPIDLLIGPPTIGPPPATPEQQYIRNYRTDLTHNLQLAFNFVREHSEVKKFIQKSNYDKHTSKRQFILGDLVWVQLPTPQIGNTTITGKLRPKYQGPCRLVKQLSPSTFIVTRLNDNVNIGSTNVDRMKLYYEPQENDNIASSTTAPVNVLHSRRFPIRKRRPPIRF